MKTYLGWTTLMPWHKYFAQYSIDVRVNQISKSLSLWHLSWLLRPLVLLSMCFFMASLQVYATDLDVSAQDDANSIIDVPTVIPGVIPIEFDLDASTIPGASYEKNNFTVLPLLVDSMRFSHGCHFFDASSDSCRGVEL